MPEQSDGPMDNNSALVSAFFNLSGGRRQDSAETFSVMPSLATRTDAEAAFFAVAEASTTGPMGSRARRLAIEIIQQTYTGSVEGSPASRLKIAAQAAGEAVASEFDGHVRVGVSVIVVEDGSIYLLQVPPTQAYVLHAGSLHSVASGSPSNASPFGHALGAADGASVSVYRDTLDVDDVIALCSTWFARELDGEELRETFSSVDVEDITASLFAAAHNRQARDVTCVAIQAVAGLTQPETLEHDAGSSSTDQEGHGYLGEALVALTNVGRFLSAELRPPPSLPRAPREPIPHPPLDHDDLSENAAVDDGTVTNATELPEPQALSEDVTDFEESSYGEAIPTDRQSASAHGPEAVGTEQATQELPIVGPDIESPQDWDPAVLTESMAEPDEEADLRFRVPSSESLRAGHSARATAADLEAVNSFIQSTPSLGNVAPPVQAFPDTSVAPERIYPADRNLAPVGRRPRLLGGVPRPGRRESPQYRESPVLQPRVGDFDAGRASFRVPRVPPVVFLWSAAAIGLFVIAVAAWLLFRSHPVAVPDYPSRSIRHSNLALASHNLKYQTYQLSLAHSDIRLARHYDLPSQRIATALAAYQHVEDVLHHIIRINRPRLVADFSAYPNSHPSQIAGGSGVLYVLDSGRQILYALIPGQSAKLSFVARPGDLIDGITWGVPRATAADGSTLLAIDQNYAVLRYTMGQVRTAEQLDKPVSTAVAAAAATFGGNVYLLDTSTGQIWKYVGGPTGYSAVAAQYLASPQPSTLGRAVSLAIDGDVYVGLRGGTILKYTAGTLDRFKLALPYRLRHLTQIYTRSGLYSLFIADPADNRIVQVGKHGRYIRTFVLSAPLARGFRQLTISGDGRTLYFLSGNRAFRIAIPR